MDGRVSPQFRVSLVPEAGDIDWLGHVSNVTYLEWVLRAAQDHSAAVGYDANMYAKQGAVFVVRKHELEYLLPAIREDKIELVTWVADWKGASTHRATSIRRKRDDAELARGLTLWAYVDLETGRPRRIPAELKEAFAERSAA